MKMLLTSTGFDNKALEAAFLRLLPVPAAQARVLFIPTAARDADARAMVPACRADLTNAGVLAQNIHVYDCDHPLTAQEAQQYAAVYVCGGTTEYLMDRLQAVDFKSALDAVMANGGVYVGASAGAIAACAQPMGGMGYLSCTLQVHCAKGTPDGTLDTSKCPVVRLTNAQGILLTDTQCRILS